MAVHHYEKKWIGGKLFYICEKEGCNSILNELGNEQESNS